MVESYIISCMRKCIFPNLLQKKKKEKKTHTQIQNIFFLNREYANTLHFLKNQSLALFQKNYHLLLSLQNIKNILFEI